jgi:hypothetical protein
MCHARVPNLKVRRQELLLMELKEDCHTLMDGSIAHTLLFCVAVHPFARKIKIM